MAEGWTNNVLCRYFMNSSCRNGAGCPYAHDRSLAQTRLPCKFYRRGTCAYGNKCKYLHDTAASGQTDDEEEAAADDDGDVDGASGLTPPQPPPQKQKQQQKSIAKMTSPNSSDPESKAEAPTASQRVTSSWADAPEFVPSSTVPYWPGSGCDGRNYSEVVQGNIAAASPAAGGDEDPALLPLCPYAAVGECRYGEYCALLHGDVCEYCQCAVLHPRDPGQRARHQTDCLKTHEKDMEHSFRLASSLGKMCGVCMEVVLEKNGSNTQRFGILPGCNHCFCVACIRQWRASDQFESKVTRGCPECRVHSDFVCPSRYWVDAPDEKKRLIDGYIRSCSEKPCKHFKEGRGECPFGDKCFYQHVYPDGAKAKLGPPRRRKRQNHLLETELMQDVLLSDFLEEDAILEADLEDEDNLTFNLRVIQMLGERFNDLLGRNMFLSDLDSD